MKNYTLLEAARQLGLTKNAIKYRYKKLPESVKIIGENGTLLVTEEGLALLRDAVQEPPEEPAKEPVRTTRNRQKPGKKPVSEPSKTSFTDGEEPPEKPPKEGSTEAVLLGVIETLKDQLATKDKQIEDLSRKIDGQTALAIKLTDQVNDQAKQIKLLEAAVRDQAVTITSDRSDPVGQDEDHDLTDQAESVTDQADHDHQDPAGPIEVNIDKQADDQGTVSDTIGSEGTVSLGQKIGHFLRAVFGADRQ